MSLSKMDVEKPPGLKLGNRWKTLEVSESEENEEESQKTKDLKSMEKAYCEEFPKTIKDNSGKLPKHQGPKMGSAPKKFDDKLLTLFFKEPLAEIKELNPVIREDGGWTRIKGIMDSGASESVAHPGMTPEYEVQESPGSKAGQKYTCANGETIENLGEKILDMVTEDGRESRIKYQAADVSRTLNSISGICDAGASE